MLTLLFSIDTHAFLSNEQLNIKVKDADGNEVFFKVKKHTRLAKLKKAYAEKMGKSENSVRFITSDGNRIADEDTAETVRLGGKDDAHASHRRTTRRAVDVDAQPLPLLSSPSSSLTARLGRPG
jgi:small ubiquitin-related modifier